MKFLIILVVILGVAAIAQAIRVNELAKTLTDKREEDIDIAWAPGSFEIPLVAKKMAESGRYDAVICLGAVIRGGTPHFDYIASEVSKGIAKVGLDTGLPVILGVITADTLEQAIERAGTKSGNYGSQAAAHAIEMANLGKAIAGS